MVVNNDLCITGNHAGYRLLERASNKLSPNGVRNEVGSNMSSLSRNPIRCVVCSSASRWLMTKNSYDLYKCTVCCHIQVWPVPSAEFLRQLYSAAQSYHVQKQGLPKFGEGGYRQDQGLRAALAQILEVKRAGKFLDVGCSEGEMLWLAQQNGFTPFGIEVNADTASIAGANNHIAVFVGTVQEARLPDKEFDVIFLGDVIEHVPDLVSFLGEISRILRSDGVVYVRTPNHQCFFPRSTYFFYSMFRIPWSHPTPPHHVHQFTLVSLEMLFKKFRFRVVKRKFSTCSLNYELRNTTIFSRLKKAAKKSDYLRCMLLAAIGMLVIVMYTSVWVVNRLFNWTGPDFAMDALFQREEI